MIRHLAVELAPRGMRANDFPELAIMPGTLIVEAFGQSASILFSRTTSLGLRPGEFLMLRSGRPWAPAVSSASRDGHWE